MTGNGFYYQTVVHRVGEFTKLPWYDVVPDGCGADWSFGRGGHGLGDDAWSINYVDEAAGTIVVCELPAPIGAMIIGWAAAAVEDKLRDIRNVLGVA